MLMKRLLILLLTLLFILCLVACGDSPTDATEPDASNTEAPTNDASSEENIDGILLSGENRFRIIHPQSSSKTLALKIYDKLVALDKEAWKNPYTLTSDKAEDKKLPEILVGLTNRAESEEARALIESYPDFVISISDNRIAIFANTEKRLEAAVEYFISNMKVSDDGKVFYAQDKTYVDKYAGDFKDAMIDGAPLADFSIVLSANATEAQKQFAQILSNEISVICGTNVNIRNDSSAEEPYEILIGETSRLDSVTRNERNDFMMFSDGKLLMLPADDSGYVRLLNYFISATNAVGGKLNARHLSFESLSYADIQSVTTGALLFTENMNGLLMNKCTAHQIKLWENLGYSKQVHSSSGIRLDFLTDSKNFLFKASVGKTFELRVNGETRLITKNGELSAVLDNSAGENRITVIFPNHEVDVTVSQVLIDDGASLSAVEYDKKVLFLGDSITQGYTAQTDSCSYANRLATMLNSNTVIQGISGAKFEPTTIDPNLNFDPDYIFVAFGTNDWSWGRKDFETFSSYAKDFFETLAQTFPKAKIIAITPIWRKDNQPSAVGEFEAARAEIAKLATQAGAFVVDGIDLVPHESQFYADSNCLHPNDAGFEHYANNLYEAIKDIVK